MSTDLLPQLVPLSLSPWVLVRHLLVALACGFLVAGFYHGVNRRQVHQRTFATSLVALPVITALVIVVIGDNLARAFGLVGAMSIIRFRTAVKDVQDILFIYFALAVGMAAGIGLYVAAVLGTVLVGAVLWGLAHAGSLSRLQRQCIVSLSYQPGDGAEDACLAALRQHCRSHQLVSSRAEDGTEAIDLTYYVRLASPEATAGLVDALRRVPGVRRANVFFDEEYS